MGLKHKLVGMVGIVALAAGLVFGGLAVTDDASSHDVKRATDSQGIIIQAWPAKYWG